jgi:LCP family protein required for cell wall assembly
MDSNRTRTSSQPKAVDGFFTRASRGSRRSVSTVKPLDSLRPMSRQASMTGMSGQRQVNDFKRTDGFHAAPRRAAGLPASAAGKLGSRALAAQFQPTAADKPQAEGRSDKHTRFGRHGRAHKSQASHSKFRTFRKWAFRTTAFVLILVIVAGGLLFGKGYFKLKKVFNGTTTAAALQTNVNPSLLKGEGDGRINILLLGIGGPDHDGSDLTDTMMIASIDPVNNQAVLFSIPRDLWVKMPNNYIASYQKINAAYESGKYNYLGQIDDTNTNQKAIDAGFDAVDSTVEDVMGVPIHYNVLVNFQAFQQAVNTIGGVTINAPEELYDPTMAWQNGWSPILAKAGINNFNGAQALNYVRSRETTSDFARGERQRAVIVAIKDKVMNLGTLSNPLKLSSLLNTFGSNVQTDISLSDMTRLVGIMKKIPSSQIQSVGLTDPPNNFVTTGDIDGLSVVEPSAGLDDYDDIQTFVRSELKDGYITKENANVTVLNGTVSPGLAATKAAELKSYGYNVGTVASAPTTDYATTEIIDLSHGSKKYTLNYLKNRFHVSTLTTALPAGIVQGSANIVIILGTDATVTTNQ